MPILRFLKDYALALSLLVPCLLIQLFADNSLEIFRYQQHSVAQGEWWRILTANFTHSNWIHWALNMAGLILIDYFYQPVISQKNRAYLMLFCLIVNVLMIHVFLNLTWYVGMSGALHGYLVGGALLTFSQYKKLNSAVLIIVAGKLTAEMLWEINFATSNMIEANVVEESHLFGAISAVIYWLLISLQKLIKKGQ